jgi:hypothetical protein
MHLTSILLLALAALALLGCGSKEAPPVEQAAPATPAAAPAADPAAPAGQPAAPRTQAGQYIQDARDVRSKVEARPDAVQVDLNQNGQ